MAAPHQVLYREPLKDQRNVILAYRYTPAERGQILAFVWWVYVNRGTWTRAQLNAAVTSISPLMMFSSGFLSEMTGIPGSTITKNMVKSREVPAARITGSCDMLVVHRLLEAALYGVTEYRETVRELAVTKEVPDALLSRMAGVPKDILLRPERGMDFFAEAPDLIDGIVCSIDQVRLYRTRYEKERRSYDAAPGDQRSIRDALAGTQLGEFRTTHTPVPDEGDLPHHLAIPGLPALREAHTLGNEYLHRVQEWQMRYRLPASTRLGAHGASEHP